MSMSVNQKVESEFNLLEISTSEENWQDAKYVRDLATNLEDDNLPLAFRLMQRAHNLNPTGPVIKRKLANYTSRLNAINSPILEESSSSDTDSHVDQSNSQENNKEKNVFKKVFDLVMEKINLVKPFTLFVIIPSLAFAFYQIVWASERFESTAQLLVKQPEGGSVLSPEMALLSGFGVATADNDATLVEAYINSNDMLEFLEQEMSLSAHFRDYSVDFFSRLHLWNSHEDFLGHYRKHVVVTIDTNSSIILVRAQGYTSEFAHKLNVAIIDRAEWFINEIGYNLANEQIAFMSREHQKWTDNLQNAQNSLMSYQRQNGLLDPTSEGIARQSITYNIEAQITSKKAELIAAEKIMSAQAPEVMSIKNQLLALEEQLLNERSQLTNASINNESMNKIIAKFSELKINYELALQAYAGSLASLEKTRTDAYRQLKYLVTVEKPTRPDDNTYPSVFYNIVLFSLVFSLLFGIARIVMATIAELS